jgi:uncharacterized membrane protein YkoI
MPRLPTIPLPTLALAIVLALAPTARAADTAPSAAPNGAGAPEPRIGASQVSAFAQVRVSLLRAVQMLQSLQPQGRVLTAAFTVPAEGTAAYAVTTLINGSERHYLVDAATAAVTRNTAQPDVSEQALDPTTKGEVRELLEAHADLAQAVIAAQREGGGNAIETAYEEVRGTTYYLVTVVAGGALHTYSVDIESGLPRPQGVLTAPS